MSDSELSEASAIPIPPDHELEKTLRDEVVDAQKNDIEYTVNSIRTASEEKLGLDKGFYKNSAEWAQRSKDIIKDQTVRSSVECALGYILTHLRPSFRPLKVLLSRPHQSSPESQPSARKSVLPLQKNPHLGRSKRPQNNMSSLKSLLRP